MFCRWSALAICLLIPGLLIAQPPSRLGNKPTPRNPPAHRNQVSESSILPSQPPPAPVKETATPANLPTSTSSASNASIIPASNQGEKLSSALPPKEEIKTASAMIKLKLPENASVWVEEQQMKQSGSLRTFQSPALESGKTYYYKLKVTWATKPGQKDFLSEQDIAVRAGETTTVDFTPIATHSKYVSPLLSTSDMIRQSASKTPAPQPKE